MKPKSEKIPNDIAVDRNTDLLYCDGSSGTVYRVKNGQTEEMIVLQGWTPSKLCVASTGDLLVTVFSIDQAKVVRYTDLQRNKQFSLTKKVTLCTQEILKSNT